MIIGRIEDFEKYFSVNVNFRKALEWLKVSSSAAVSQKIEIDGEKVWGKIFLDSGENKVYEAHRKFIDIHFIVSGEEEFAWSDINALTVTKEYDSSADYLLLDGNVNNFLMKEGMFCICFPEDAHIPGYSVKSDKAKRAMVKVEIQR